MKLERKDSINGKSIPVKPRREGREILVKIDFICRKDGAMAVEPTVDEEENMIENI